MRHGPDSLRWNPSCGCLPPSVMRAARGPGAGSARREASTRPRGSWQPSDPSGRLRSMEPQGTPGGGRQADPSSLVPYAGSVDEPEVEVCPRRPLWLVSESTGAMVPASCRTYSCPVCGPRKARRIAQAATWAAGQADRARFVTLTLFPDDWQKGRQKIRDLRRMLARRGLAWDLFWAVERGSQTGMRHAHGIQHGDYIPQALLQDVWGARVDIRAVARGSVSGYVLKDAARVSGYSVKGSADMGEHLLLNGNRVAHWSRGFFHGRTLDQAFAVACSGGKDDGPWVPARTHL